MTQATSFPEIKPNQIFYIGCMTNLLQAWPSYFCPCLAFGKGCEHSNGWAAIQTKNPHQKQLARIGLFIKGY